MWYSMLMAIDFQKEFYQSFIQDNRYRLLVSGIGLTVKISIAALCAGMVIGFIIALFNLSNNK